MGNKSILYIVGNGFDLYHDIPSNYSDFHCFCKNRSTEYGYWSIARFLDYIYTNHDVYIWSNFEASLAYPDMDSIVSLAKLQQQQRPNTPSSMTIDDHGVNVCFDIKSYVANAFQLWVKSLNENLNKNINYYQQLLCIDKNALFLTYNYTKTLELVYNIKQDNIYHVHIDENQEFGADNYYMFGCGDFESSSSKLHDTIEEYETLMVKPVRKIIQSARWKNWLNSLQDINDIYVLGHSLNDIDMPYFIEIAQKCSRVKWHVSYYTEEDKIGIEQQLNKLNISYELHTMDKILQDTSM